MIEIGDSSDDEMERGAADGRARLEEKDAAEAGDADITIIEEQEQPPPPPQSQQSQSSQGGPPRHPKGVKRPASASSARGSAASPALPASSWSSSQEDILFPHSSALGAAAPVHRLQYPKKANGNGNGNGGGGDGDGGAGDDEKRAGARSTTAGKRERGGAEQEEEEEGEEHEREVAWSMDEILRLGLPIMQMPAWATATPAEELKAGFNLSDRPKKKGKQGKGGGAAAAAGAADGGDDSDSDGVGEVIDSRPWLRSTAAQALASYDNGNESSSYVQQLRWKERVAAEQAAKKRRLDEDANRAIPIPPPTPEELMQQWAEREEGVWVAGFRGWRWVRLDLIAQGPGDGRPLHCFHSPFTIHHHQQPAPSPAAGMAAARRRPGGRARRGGGRAGAGRGRRRSS